MTSKSSHEVRSSLIQEFGERDGFLVHVLTSRTAQLALEWRFFLYLFCGPVDRVRVLNDASPIVATTLSNTLWDNALTTIRRLTDNVESSSNRNVSLGHLELIAGELGRDGVAGRFESLQGTAKPIRKYVDKYIAHADYSASKGDGKISITRGETTHAIKEIVSYVSLFHEVVRDTTYCILPVTTAADEQQFLMRLYQGNLFDALEKDEHLASAKSGVYRKNFYDDLPEWIWDPEFRDDPF